SLIGFVAFVIALSGGIVDAQTPSPSPAASASASATATSSPAADLGAQRIDELFTKPHVSPDIFAAVFLNQVSASKVEEIVSQLKAGLGEYKGVKKADDHYVATFAKGTDDVFIHFDAENKIDGLFFKTPRLAAASLDDALKRLAALPGRVSYLVLKGRNQLAALDADAPLSVGSTFKLAILNALVDEVNAGRLRWDQSVPLRGTWKSLPSGVLQTWPDGSAITLQTYATLMISQSDNTAADALHSIVGAAALARYRGPNDPFLTTLQVFKLKSAAGRELLRKYRSASTAMAREAILRELDRLPRPKASDLALDPRDLDIEWHYSAARSCDLIRRVADLPLFSVNPGVADAAQWKAVAYKGGSDAGVINMTTFLRARDGTAYCVSATENDRAKAIDETAFSAAYGAVLGQL
ncbi:MAG: serine hydrolase, partial [Candidatus Eremiobacteraeota bacterium]|nr:serine hydrolase [Candidatus Eremiobacteraeota bacterium]